MAMLILSIVVVGMTPPIFLTVGTRIQNRRVEQAVQLAQGEIDRVRVMVEQGNYTSSQLPAVPITPAITAPIQNVSAPTTSDLGYIRSGKTCTTPNTSYLATTVQMPATKAWRVDINRDCKMDFLVQIFRDGGFYRSLLLLLPLFLLTLLLWHFAWE